MEVSADARNTGPVLVFVSGSSAAVKMTSPQERIAKVIVTSHSIFLTRASFTSFTILSHHPGAALLLKTIEAAIIAA